MDSSPSDSKAPAGFPKIARFRFIFCALDPIRLPPYSGSAWRGLLGRGLRRSVCVTRQARCDGCLLIDSCLYSSFFESPGRRSGVPERGDSVPHPFVLSIAPDAPREYAPGETLMLGINLIGDASRPLPYLVHALGQAGQRGIGQGEGRFELLRVEAEPDLGAGGWRSIHTLAQGRLDSPPEVSRHWGVPPSSVGLRLTTPLRIKRHGRLVGPREFTADHLLRQLSRRFELLTRLYADPGQPVPLPVPAVSPLQLAQTRLRWRDWTRYSSRQRELMNMGGLIGELVLDGPELPALWPWLWLGQWLHLGKATSMGLGRYRLMDAASLP
jgi:hypothetical protein